MRPLTEFFRDKVGGPMDWALAGKGPSFARRAEANLDRYRVLGLNHVCLHWPCDLTHFTDLDAFLDCGTHLAGQPGAVVLPWYPHTRNRPGKRTLLDLVETVPLVARLHAQRQLYSYNSTLSRGRLVTLPTHTVRYFSAVVGLDILARNGVKTVHTIGIDGGKAYAPDFDPKTLLSNGRDSFDVQFGEMRKIAAKFKVTVRPIVEARR